MRAGAKSLTGINEIKVPVTAIKSAHDGLDQVGPAERLDAKEYSPQTPFGPHIQRLMSNTDGTQFACGLLWPIPGDAG